MNPDKMDSYFGPEGLLAQKIEGFEFRAPQLDMARAVAQCMATETPLLAEAGTGTGKTWSYLIPAIESGKKVVISTGTKTLQDQIFDHDVPLLKRLFFPNLQAVCIKGRRNYLCKRRFREFSFQPSFWNKDEAKLFYRLQQWASRTRSGERAEITWLPDNVQLWHALTSGGDQCPGQKCEDHPTCFLTRLRQESGRANLLIVNHHLFFADLALRARGLGGVIPEYKAVVFDEAHQLEDIIGQYFGIDFSDLGLMELVHDIDRECRVNMKQMVQKEGVTRIKGINDAGRQLEALCRRLRHALGGTSAPGGARGQNQGQVGRFRLDVEKAGKEFVETSDMMVHALEHLSAALSPFVDSRPVLDVCSGRCLELAASLRSMVEQKDESLIYWYELAPRGVFLHGAPVELAPIVRSHLFRASSSVVFASATISTAGSFGFFRSRLGIPDESREILLASPFDFDRQGLLYLPSPFPAPADSYFCARMAEEASKVLIKTRGRALFLFTSYRNMNQVREMIGDRIPYPMLMQGQKPKRVLLNEFKENVESVLLATSSFWQGIDVPGEALSCVLIDKLPFEVPDDPLTAARIDLLTRQGKNAFFDYQVPRAIIHLKQGVGRLLRSSTDRGVVVIFDNRLATKSYGRLFLKSLPPYRVMRNMEELDAFFARPQPQPKSRRKPQPRHDEPRTRTRAG